MRALVIARSDADLPVEWVERAERVGRSSSRTFTPMLGTALLAKATNRQANALSLQAGSDHRGYSARSLAKDVLVPLSVRNAVDLRTSGREPLNNQPFFGADVVGTSLKVKPKDSEDLDHLIECLQRADFLEGIDALHALAAFLRVRLLTGSGNVTIRLGEGVLGFPELAVVSEAFVSIDTEGGRRGQALVAAAFDLVFDDVRTARVNDPSVTWPGDVVVLDAAGVNLSVEVKQRPTSDTEIMQFAARLGRDGIGRGVVVVLHPSARDLDPSALRLEARKAYGVEMSLIASVADLLGQAFLWTSLALPVALREFPRRMLVRLQDLESSPDGQEEWVSRFHV